MNLAISRINFLGKPENYGVIDNYVSRSAQPKKEDLKWLKEQGVTDVFNFRTMYAPEINYNEAEEVKKLGMNYHSIPSITTKPNKKNIDLFLKEVEDVKKAGGKAHIHCKSGADRTGMYAFIYKILHGLGSIPYNQAEWFDFGYHYKRYPELMDWTRKFVQKRIK